MARPTFLPLAALLGLLLTAPPLIATEAPVAAPDAVASPEAAETATPPSAEPAAPPPPEAAAAAAPVSDAPTLPPAAIEGTRLLFTRLSLRIKRIELELLDAPQEAMVGHLEGAAALLQQLRSRYLTDDEALRADRAEQYLQELMLHYTERQAAAENGSRRQRKSKR